MSDGTCDVCSLFKEMTTRPFPDKWEGAIIVEEEKVEEQLDRSGSKPHATRPLSIRGLLADKALVILLRKNPAQRIDNGRLTEIIEGAAGKGKIHVVGLNQFAASLKKKRPEIEHHPLP